MPQAPLRASQAACNSPSPQKMLPPPPLANLAYAHHGLLLRNLFEEMHSGRQLFVCSTLYVYALQNLFRGQKIKIVAHHILKCTTCMGARRGVGQREHLPPPENSKVWAPPPRITQRVIKFKRRN